MDPAASIFSRSEIILLELAIEGLSDQCKASTQAGVAIMELLGKLEYLASTLATANHLTTLPAPPGR